MSRACFFTIIVSLLSNFLEAQNHFYTTRNYTALNGLPQSQITAMVEDKNGYLWVGTQGGGLARFDGREFKIYTTLDGLLNNLVVGLQLDKHDNLWILHSKGVTKFDGLDFTKFQLPLGASSRPRQMWRIFQVNDTVFTISGRDRVTKIFKDSVYYWEKPIEKNIRRMHIGPHQEACFLFMDGTVLVRSKDNTITFKTKFEAEGLYNFFNYKDDLLLHTKEGVFKLDTVNKQFLKLPWSTNDFVYAYDERKDVLWTANESGLLKVKLNSEDAKPDTILREVEVTQVLSDSEGSTWIATNGNGLYKYFEQDFRRVGSETIRGVMALLKDRDGTTWIGTMSKGLWKIKDGKTTSYFDAKYPYRNFITTIRESPDGEIWFGTANGLGRYNKLTDSFKWITREDGLKDSFVGSLAFDDSGAWIGTGNGLSFYEHSGFKNFSTDKVLNGNNISTILYLKKYQTLFVGTVSSLYSLKNGKISLMAIPELANTSILSLYPYKDSLLLVGTPGSGMGILDLSTNKLKLITTRDGLASDFIYFAVADERNYLWIGTEKGINRVRLDKQLDIVENLHFDYDNGLTGVETNQNAFYLSPKEKYFGLVDGFYEFNQAVDRKSMAFNVHLTDVQILYGEYSSRTYSDSTFGLFKIPYQPIFPADKNHLTFHFNRVDKRYSKSVKYKYFLENFDTKWSQPSSVNSMTYSNLPPGEYIFRVMAANNEGSWARTKIAYPFTIKAPFYKTLAFMVGMFILAGGLITLGLYVRVRQRINRTVMMERIRQKEQELLRKEIARDFHDEMGNQLTRIINYVSLLKLNGNGKENNGADLYTKVEESAKYLYTGTRDFIWSIDPVNDELSKLFIYIRDFGEKLFEEKNISFRAYNEVKETIKLPYGFCREANLIFKEAMTNAFKYSEAKNVSLMLKRDIDRFEMSLEDDGIGFYTDDIQKSNGLQNIRERADRIQATLRIQSNKHLGTKIILNFKLTKTLKYGLAL